jgi:hypothetical protein
LHEGKSHVTEEEQQLIVFESAASDYFQNKRTFHGLNEFPTTEEEEKTVIFEGQVGIASGYAMISPEKEKMTAVKTADTMVVKDIEDI